ncbi:hypothetical protein NKI39_19515 [Mesorhizobium sp. M0664]|uniref:hypothetical protein n=1 Tax=Mesorhizobium sp. M0664 TaxID=2956982 RepID=UPI00333A4F4B
MLIIRARSGSSRGIVLVCSRLILDIKRSLGSYRPQEADRLRFRMLAVAAIAPEWVAEHQGPLLVKIETANVDGADQVSDPERGVFRLSEIDELLESEGTADSIRQFREAFSGRVQDELARRCQTLAGDHVEPRNFLDGVNPAGDHPLPRHEQASVVSLQASVTQQPRFGYAQRSSSPNGNRCRRGSRVWRRRSPWPGGEAGEALALVHA